MGSAVGIQTYFGCAEETVYGTAVAPSRFFPLVNETLKLDKQFITPKGMRGGSINARKGSSRTESARSASGTVVTEVATTGFGRIFKHLLGSNPSGGLQDHRLGSQQGKFLTLQKQLRDSAGTNIATYTYPGSKLLSGTFSIAVEQYLELSLEVNARDEVTNIAAAAASYSNSPPFSFMQGTLRVGGTAVGVVTNASITVNHALKTGAFYLGSGGLQREPTDNDNPGVNGTISAEFDNVATFYDLYASNTPVAVVLEFLASGAQMTITVPEARFDGETPQVGGPDVVTQNAPFTGWANAANDPAIQIEYQDATV